MNFSLGRLNFLLLTLAFCSATFAQAPYNRLYGTYATETGKKGFICSDSTVYALGSSSAFTGLSSQVYLIKTSKNGNLLWSRFFGEEGVDDATDMYYHTDTSIYIVASTYAEPAKGYDIRIVKTDTAGIVQWEKTFGTMDWDIPARIIRISDTSFAVCGHTYGNTLGLADGMLFAFTESGDSLWFKNTGTVNDDMLYDLVLKNADTLAACGETYAATGEKRAWLTEISLTGLTGTSYIYGSAYNYTFNAMDLMPGGSYIIGLTTDSSGGTQNDMHMWKVHPVSHTVQQDIPMYAGNDEYCTDVFQHNGEYYILGNTTTYGLGGYDALVYRFDTLGGWFIAGYTFGTSEDDYGNDLFLNNNGTFTVVGTSPHVFGPQDLWIINVDTLYEVNDTPDSDFDVNEVAEIRDGDKALVVYPNPAHEGFYISSSDPAAKVLVTDAMGRVVTVSTAGNYINLQGAAPGVYGVSVQFSDGTAQVKKLLLR